MRGAQSATDASHDRMIATRHLRPHFVHHWVSITGRAFKHRNSSTTSSEEAYQLNHLHRMDALTRRTSASPGVSHRKRGWLWLWRRRRASSTHPRASREALPGATLAEKAGGRQREPQVSHHDTPPEDLGGLDPHPAASFGCGLRHPKEPHGVVGRTPTTRHRVFAFLAMIIIIIIIIINRHGHRATVQGISSLRGPCALRSTLLRWFGCCLAPPFGSPGLFSRPQTRR